MRLIENNEKKKRIPKISVIIPIYNVEKYVKDCINSLICQTIKDIEIICVNDCTQDRSQEIIDEYAALDDRFYILKHSENRGLAAARNTGLDVASGQYIFFLDSDDFLSRNDALEILYNAAIEDNADETIGGTLKWREDTDEKYLDWHKNYLSEEIRGQNLKKLPQLKSNVVAWNKLLKRSFLLEYCIKFNDVIRKNEDNPFSVKVHVMARRITIIPETTYIYRQHDTGSIMTTVKKNDAFYRCSYCYDIFKFIEEEESRSSFRKIYYPMYSRQLLIGAAILEQFKPTIDERNELLLQWEKIVNILPEKFPGIPTPQREIFKLILKKNIELAWNKALLLSKPESAENKYIERDQSQIPGDLIREIIEQQEINKLLLSQIQTLYKSRSWRLTGSLRWFLSLVRGY